MNRGARVEPTPPECALACEMFDHFCAAGTMKQILALHREICKTLTLKPNKLPDFYPKLKTKLASSWKAQALFKKFDVRANHKVYAKGRVCSQNKVLIIGAGPCGLRAAIECQLLGAKVVVIEKRDRMSRNNVLHLWPFVIQDLRALGAKKFFGKFCAGSIDHICIRQLQCILLKVALLLGVEFHEGVSFEGLVEPSVTNSETLGWRARVMPADHPVSQYEFDSLMGADGKRNTLQGFKRKEFRGKLAMAITANFINRHSEQEASVPEISGVAFIFNQKFFKDLYEVTGIDLENIVYYKDDTHYFVMTAKKHSLLDKGVLLNDYNDVTRLLSVENVDRAALMRYAQEAARFSTDGQLPLLDFALNHYGEPDVALFDFTSMYAAENASIVYERLGRRLLCQLVGDSLLEPFWPTGSGCARGFLSALDAAWAVRSWGQTPTPHPLEVIAERESIYRLLAQTTPENLHRDFGAYTLDPGTRYPNLNRTAVTAHRVTSFYDSDDPLPLDATASVRKRRREAEVSDEALAAWVGVKEGGIRAAASPPVLAEAVRRYRPDLLPEGTPPRAVYQILQHELGIVPYSSGGTLRDVSDAKLRTYLTRVYNAFKGEVPHIHHESDVFDQIKLSMQKQKHTRNQSDHPVSAYSTAAEADKTHSSYNKRKRRSKAQVSIDPADSIRKKVGKLNLDDITQVSRLIHGLNATPHFKTIVENKTVEKKRAMSEELRSEVPKTNDRRPSDIVEQEMRHFEDPYGSLRVEKRVQLFERRLSDTLQKGPLSIVVPRKTNISKNIVKKMRRMSEIFDGNARGCTPTPERKNKIPILQTRRQLFDLGQGPKDPPITSQIATKDNQMHAFRMQRVSDVMERRNADAKRPKSGGRRKAQKEIMKLRFDKSLQMLATEPRVEVPSADLENDYGLQQYRASAPHFGERVKLLERQLQHYEEGRIVGGGGRTAGGGARVAKLAAELSGNNSNSSAPKASKPKDLMRSVGKIERDDWNMKEIERKILENKLGRPEPKTAERVPKWDREQFLGRQRKLKEGEGSDEKWGEIDETIHKLDQKLRDSGRPDHGTKKVANLATKFVNEPEPEKSQPVKEEAKKSWRGPSTAGVQCAACGTRVFAAEGVTADGLQLHRACFRCAICKAVLRPGNYTMERYGSRLVCLRHSGVSVPDAVASLSAPQRTQTLNSTPERISVELSDSGAREIDEDEWTDRNFLASETSCAGGLSDEEESSSEDYADAGGSNNEGRPSPEPLDDPPRHNHTDIYFSDDSFGYDDYSDDGAESSGNESCSRMREAREARRREVPAEGRPSSYSSEVESEESESSDEEVSSATEVSTDSEFAREESAPPAPPAILVTEAPPPPPQHHPAPQEYPLSRTRSAGGLATKRALELKRKYLLGEPSPPAVRKSDSASQIDSKFEAFRSNITEFQKMLSQAATSTSARPPVVAYRTSAENNIAPMPDIIKNLCTDAPVDLLTKVDTSLLTYISEKSEPVSEEKKPKDEDVDLDSDSLSEDDSSHTETAPKNVPRLEVHDEGGELIQLDSLTIINSSTEEHDKASCTGTGTGPTVRAAESESSESGRDATTLALTETELSSDWAAEGPALDDNAYHEKEKKRSNPRTLSGPKLVHDAKNIAAVSSHVCGRTSPPQHIGFSNALEHFEFADEGDQDPSIETPTTPKNEGYMELVDDDFEFSPGNDRSMNFIERSFSETVVKPTHEPHVEIVHTIPKEMEEIYTDSEIQSPQGVETESSEKSVSENKQEKNDSKTDSKISDEKTDLSKVPSNGFEQSIESLSITEVSPQSKSQPLFSKTTTESETLDDVSPPLVPDTPSGKSNSILSSVSLSYSGNGTTSIRLYSPAICRSASETFNRSTGSSDSHTRSFDPSFSITLSSGSVSPVSPAPSRRTTIKVLELKRERDEQTEVVRRLVLERLGSGARATGGRRGRRPRVTPNTVAPPPVPPPPVLPIPPVPPPPPRPAPPLLSMPVTPSFSDPELARETRSKSIMKSISNYLNRHLGPRQKEPQSPRAVSSAHKSMGALQESAPPVPPPPACYCPHTKNRPPPARLSGGGDEERDVMQLWFEARWARLVAQRRAREESSREEPTVRRLARLERRLTRPLSAEQQAATVAELVQVSAQREAHQALMKADRRRSAASSGD